MCSYTNLTANGNSITAQYIYFSPLQTKTNNFDYIEIPFMLTGNQYTNNSSTITTDDILTCRRFYCQSYDPDGSCARWRCDEWYTASSGQTNTINITSDINFSFNITLQQSGGANQAPCTVNGDKLKCYLQKDKTYGALVLQYNLTANNQNIPLRLNFGHVVGRYKDSQISIIEATQNQTQSILNENTTYDQNATKDFTNETQEVENYTQAEQDLMKDLDFNTTDMNITINPNASQFIWNIVDGLRSINGAIVLLMTSLLSIGVIKLVLGR